MSDLIRNVENFVNWLMPNRKGKMFLKTTHTLHNIYRAAWARAYCHGGGGG
jgi:hypothetical protein